MGYTSCYTKRKQYNRCGKKYTKKYGKNNAATTKMPKPKQALWQKLAGATIRYGPTVYSALRTLASKVNSELKYTDYVLPPSTINQTGNIQCLSNIVQGDTTNDRNGNSQLNHNMFIRIQMQMNIENDPVAQKLRVITFVWNDDASQNIPTITDILENITMPHISPLNLETSKYYSIISDKIYTLTQAQTPALSLKKYVKLNPLHSKYDGPLATNYTFGHIFVLAVSDQVAFGPTLNYYSRIRYYDN